MKKSLFSGGNRDFFAYKHNGIKVLAIQIGICQCDNQNCSLSNLYSIIFKYFQSAFVICFSF